MAAGAVIDENVAADRRLARDDVPSADAKLAAVDEIDLRQATGGKDHHLGCERDDVAGFHVAVGMDRDPATFQFGDPPFDDADEVAAPGARRAEEDLPADIGRRLVERNVMAALGADAGSLQPRRSTADDHDLALRPARRRGDVAEDRLPAGHRIVETGGAIGRLAMGRADAGAHVILAAGGKLFHHVRIGDLGPGHARHVDLALGDSEARRGQIGNPRGVEDRQPGLAPEGTDGLDPRRQR